MAPWKSGSATAASKASLNDGMSEKAEATARHIDQSMAELEQQLSRGTRAYFNMIDLRRADRCTLPAYWNFKQPPRPSLPSNPSQDTKEEWIASAFAR